MLTILRLDWYSKTFLLDLLARLIVYRVLDKLSANQAARGLRADERQSDAVKQADAHQNCGDLSLKCVVVLQWYTLQTQVLSGWNFLWRSFKIAL